VTTTKPVTTTEPSTAATKVIITKPSTNQNFLCRGVVVDKDLNFVVIQTQKVVSVLQRFLR
jgi:hypothetical protein